jgi:hypothetical protein
LIDTEKKVEWNHHSGRDDWSVGPKIRLASLDPPLACQKGYAALYRIAVTLGLVPLHNLNPRCPHWMQCWTVKRIPTIHRLFSEPIVFHPLVSLAMYSIAHLLLDEWHLRGDDLGFIENTVDNTYRKIPFGPVTTATASKYAAHCDKVNRRYPLQKIVFVRRCPRQTIASERREMIY